MTDSVALKEGCVRPKVKTSRDDSEKIIILKHRSKIGATKSYKIKKKNLLSINNVADILKIRHFIIVIMIIVLNLSSGIISHI